MPQAPADPPALHAGVAEALRWRLITGKITPGVGLSTRGLAQEMGVSQTPVREALARLAADGAIEIRSKRKVAIPAMTPERFDDLLQCRLLLEPKAAGLACGAIGAGLLKRLKGLDDRIEAAMKKGDPIAYMERNYAFHFGIYRANGRPTLNRIIETLWLQSGPFMREVYGRFGAANLVDQHQRAIAAIEAGDPAALEAAIAADIADGMGLIARGALAG